MNSITMSKKEIKRIPIMEKLKNGKITQKQAGRVLGITARQVRNVFGRYSRNGASGLVHQLRGRTSNRRTNPDITKKLILMAQDEAYQGYGPTELSEELNLQMSVNISHGTVRNILIKEGLWKAKQRKSKHRKWREPKESFGQMVQFDGSFHDWFEDRASWSTLLLFIDDATSYITWAAFADTESVKNVMRTSREYFLRFGLPESIYTDNGSVYKVNVNNVENERKTQFERALGELDIEIKHARSPQAKGRVERCFGTLQRRLVHQLRAQSISSITEANEYLQNVYIPWHNAKYAKNPKLFNDTHRPAPAKLENALCIKNKRVLRNDFTISYNKRLFQLTSSQTANIRPKEVITVAEHLDESISLSIRKIELNFQEIKHKEALQAPVTSCKGIQLIHKPAKDHPWRKGYKHIPEMRPNGGYF